MNQLRLLGLVLSLGLITFNAHAISYKSGDKQLDRWLTQMDETMADREKALKQIAVTFKVSNKQLDHLHHNMEWSISDLYLGLATAEVSEQSLETVVIQFDRHRGSGWKAILTQFSITPGSPAFLQLKTIIKQKVDASYREPKADNLFQQ